MDISEALFDAVGILIDKKIQSINFDSTIEATIVDDKNASLGEYLVSTGTTKFTAYSYNTQYRIQDTVLVTIPQGNYDNQKIILSKKKVDSNIPVVYKSPFEKIVNISQNLIRSPVNLSLWANGEDYSWNKEILDFPAQEDDKIIWEWAASDYSPPLQKYPYLGLQAQFSTYLAEYNTALGNYGLALQITFLEPNIEETWEKIVFLDSDSFIGDIYNFESYYTQEDVFDLSEYVDYPIVGLKLYAYQRNNFSDIYGETIPFPEDDFSSIPPNIFIKDIMICLGIPSDSFTEDTAEIYCEQSFDYIKGDGRQSLTINYSNWHRYYSWKDDGNVEPPTPSIPYFTHHIILTLEQTEYNSPSEIHIDILLDPQRDRVITSDDIKNKLLAQKEEWELQNNRDIYNKKIIQLRWIHKDEANNTVKIMSYDDTLDSQYEIRWYRYKLGAASPDRFAGAHWVRYYGIKDAPDENTQEWASDDTSINPTFQLTFMPNVTAAEERIKAIIVKDNRLVAASNVLVFTNKTGVRDEPTFLDINALSIKIDDEFNDGHYFVYDESGQLLQRELATREFKLQAVFDENEPDVAKKANLTAADCSWIQWIFPGGNSMIVPIKANNGPIEANDDPSIATYHIKEHLDNYATNNTVQLQVIKDGLTYNAYKTLTFGTAGSNGSDYKFYIDWNNGTNILDCDVTGHSQTSIKGTFKLQGQDGDIVTIPEDSTITCEYEVLKAVVVNPTPENEDDISESLIASPDLFYPILNNKDLKPLRENDTSFYFFSDIINPEEVYTFNVEKKKFEKSDESASGIKYRQCFTDPPESKKILQFVDITEKLQDTVDYDRENDRANGAKEDGYAIQDGKYYYSKNSRYFIKYDDQYILDPWDKYRPEEHYYEPREVSTTQYKPVNIIIDGDNQNEQTSFPLTIDIKKNDETITITNGSSGSVLDPSSMIILKFILSNFGDHDLVFYEPIPLKRSNVNIKYLKCPTEVRYDSSGAINFYKDPCEIKGIRTDNKKIDVPNIFWKIKVFNDDSNQDENKLKNFMPQLQETYKDKHTYGEDAFIIPVLDPPGVYFKDNYPYSLQCFFVETTNDGQNNQLIFSQPILVYQNNYPSRTLNKWNGRDIVTDEDTATIVASGFAAGRKEADNTFSGVMLGDWSKTAVESFVARNTGLYGFHHGAMSYAFKDDGTGFIGKDGKGRIYFDGNDALIYSSQWKSKDPTGMILDIDDGSIRMINNRPKRLRQTIPNPTEAVLNVYNLLSENKLSNQKNENTKIQIKYKDKYKQVNNDIYHSYLEYYYYNSDMKVYQRIISMNDYTEEVYSIAVEIPADDYGFIRVSDISQNNLFKFKEVQDFSDNLLKYYRLENGTTLIFVPQSNLSQGETYYILDESGTLEMAKQILIDDTYYLYKDNEYQVCQVGDVLTTSDIIYIKLNYQKIKPEDPNGNPPKVPKIFIKTNEFTSLKDEESISYTPETYDYEIEIYEIDDSKNYITLDSLQPTFPLSIGNASYIPSRNFKVSWDGTLYVTGGNFSGTISGSTIEGGQIIAGNNTLIDDTGIHTTNIDIWDNSEKYGEVGYHSGNNVVNGEYQKVFGIKSDTHSIAIENLTSTGNTGNAYFNTDHTIRLTSTGQIKLESIATTDFQDYGIDIISEHRGINIQSPRLKIQATTGNLGFFKFYSYSGEEKGIEQPNRIVVDSTHAAIGSTNSWVSCEGHVIILGVSGDSVSDDKVIWIGAQNDLGTRISGNANTINIGGEGSAINIKGTDLDTYINGVINVALTGEGIIAQAIAEAIAEAMPSEPEEPEP